MASIYSATFTESNGLFAPSRADSDTPRSNTHKYTHPHTLVHVLQVALKSANEIARPPINSSIVLKMTSVEWAKNPESRQLQLQPQLSRPLYAFTHLAIARWLTCCAPRCQQKAPVLHVGTRIRMQVCAGRSVQVFVVASIRATNWCQICIPVIHAIEYYIQKQTLFTQGQNIIHKILLATPPRTLL